MRQPLLIFSPRLVLGTPGEEERAYTPPVQCTPQCTTPEVFFIWAAELLMVLSHDWPPVRRCFLALTGHLLVNVPK